MKKLSLHHKIFNTITVNLQPTIHKSVVVGYGRVLTWADKAGSISSALIQSGRCLKHGFLLQIVHILYIHTQIQLSGMSHIKCWKLSNVSANIAVATFGVKMAQIMTNFQYLMQFITKSCSCTLNSSFKTIEQEFIFMFKRCNIQVSLVYFKCIETYWQFFHNMRY